MTGAFLAQARLDEALNCERQGRLADAERLYHAILAQDPVNVQAKGRLAAVAMSLGQPERALTWARAALVTDPRYAPARLSLGIALQALGRHPEAKAALEPLTRDAPDFGAAHYVLAQTLWALGEYDNASARFERALRLAPELGDDLAATRIEHLDQADWRGYDEGAALVARLIGQGLMRMDPLKFLHGSDAAADQQQCGRINAARLYPPRPPLWTGQKRRPGKIRLGYLASEFHNHAVAHVIAGVFEHHDRGRFELTAFSCCPPYPSPIRDRVVAAFDHFENLVDRDDAAIARLIRERDIDVLVYLSGYAYRGRPGILTFRPAPVQVSFLGYPGTLGAPFADYLIADRQVIPKDHTAFYDEKIVRMPHAYQPTDDSVPAAGGLRTRAQENLPEGAFVFMAYHQPSKISPRIFDVWMRILDRIPGSVLWLQDAEDLPQANLKREAAARNIDPSRLVFSKRLDSRADHMARHALADLFIDSLPYNAHSTTSDALWAGLPVVTCRGESFPGRVCSSLLVAAGFPELATDTLQDYEALILSLVSDPARLAALRMRIATQVPKSPLFATAAYTRHLEAAFQTMYERTEAGLPPASFNVES